MIGGRKRLSLIGASFVAMFVVGAMGAPHADAAVRGPSDIKNLPAVSRGYGLNKYKAKASYVVSQDGGLTNIKNTTIKIYVPASKTSTKINIHNYNMCTTDAHQLGTTDSFDQSAGINSDTGWLNGKPNVVATFSVTGGGSANNTSFTGHWRNNCATTYKSVTLKGAPVNKTLGYRIYTLRVTGNSSASAGDLYVNMFWIGAANGVIFSQDSLQDVHSFGYQLSSPIPSQGKAGGGTTYYRTALPFGSDCTVTKATTVRMSFYDLDSGNAVVQPRTMSIRLVDTTTGKAQKLTHSGAGSLTPNPAGNYRYNVKGGSLKTVYAGFTARPGHRYILYIWDIYYNNTLQFTLPYDSIYYYTICKNADLKGVTTLNNNVIVPGQSADWTHQMHNESTVGTAVHVKATIHRQVTDKNGNVTNSSKTLVDDKTIAPGGKRPSSPKKTSFSATEADVGSRICEWITWTSTTDSGNNRSGNYCAVVGRQPKIQIWGGDLRTGGDIDTSRSSIDGHKYGSWVEYGALVNGVNRASSFGSGASLAGGPKTLTAKQANPLTFANNNKDGRYGEFNNPSFDTLGSAYNVMANNLLGIPEKGNFSGGSISSLNGAYTSSGNIKITGGSVGAGKTVLIHSTGTVTISGNIKYPGTVGSIDKLPQVIIVAKNINITDAVTRIDAWLLTSGTINTCSNKNKPTTDVCSKALKINGLVTAKKGTFKRTAGASSASPSEADSPAERIDLRADSYLWEYSTASDSVVPTTVQITQLPPRY